METIKITYHFSDGSTQTQSYESYQDAISEVFETIDTGGYVVVAIGNNFWELKTKYEFWNFDLD